MKKRLIEEGIKVADSMMYQQVKIWARYSSDKVDIGEELAHVIRILSRSHPLSKRLRALSIGSSNEPQFRLLETAFRAGVYLLDIEKEALDMVKERVRRQWTDHVTTIKLDYTKTFLDKDKTRAFLKQRLGGKRMDLITLHHSLYYCQEKMWHTIFENLFLRLLANKGAMHAVLMDSISKNPYSTTHLYNHFAGKFFNHHNDQDLYKLKSELKGNPSFKRADISIKRNKVRFFKDDFRQFMAVVWMLLLYPNVHKYSLPQKREITEFVYERFWRRKRPLIQEQDHLVIIKEQ